MGRRIPDKLLPHRDLVIVHPFEGGGAQGRRFGDPVTLKRAQIVDQTQMIRDQYDTEVISSTTVFFERSELARMPEPETKITVWAGTPDERDSVVIRSARHQHPAIADIVEVNLR